MRASPGTFETRVAGTCVQCNGEFKTYNPRLRRYCNECQMVRYGRQDILDKAVDNHERTYRIARKDHFVFWDLRHLKERA